MIIATREFSETDTPGMCACVLVVRVWRLGEDTHVYFMHLQSITGNFQKLGPLYHFAFRTYVETDPSFLEYSGKVKLLWR
jgi:hypothetical protein